MFVNLGLNRFLVSIIRRREDFFFFPLLFCLGRAIAGFC